MRYYFNDYILDTACFELLKGGVPREIEPQAIELLILLLEHRERMVSKDEIYQSVWAGKVVSEAALSSRIKMIRQAVGDDGKSQHTIRTIHGKGFRFVAAIKDERLKNNTVDTELYRIKNNKPAIAVLPFLNLSQDASQEYFSDGITTDIIAYLAKHRWLNVTARNTTFCYKGHAVNIPELARKLNINYVVEGSVQKAGERVRINANLIDAQSGHQIWGEQYDRNITDIFTLQDEITHVIAARLEPEIGFSEREKIIQSHPKNLKAWDCYHLGIYHFFQFTNESNIKAQQLLLQSQQLDPQFGEAYAWWAYAVILGMVYWSTKASDKLLNEALVACDKALSFDRNNATFYALKARVLLASKEYDRAIIENEKAISLNPSFAAAHCGLGDSLAYEGRYKESIACFEKAISLSPNDPQLWAFYSYGALALIFQGDYERALEWADHASHIPNCQYWTTAHKIVALAHLKRMQEAENEKQKLLKLCPEFDFEFARAKLFYLKCAQQVDLYLSGLRAAGF